MIEMHDSGQIPGYNQDDDYDYTSKRIFEDNQSIIQTLKNILNELKSLRALVRNESPQPSIIPLPIAGNTVKFHVTTLTIVLTAAGVVSLNVGSVVERSWSLGAADTKVLDYPIVLENGKDYTLTTTAGAVSGYFTGYTEVFSEDEAYA